MLTTNAQEDPRFIGQESIIAHNLRSILCVPLKVKDELTGVIYADNRVRSRNLHRIRARPAERASPTRPRSPSRMPACLNRSAAPWPK